MKGYKKLYLRLCLLLMVFLCVGCSKKNDLKASNEDISKVEGKDEKKEKEFADIEELAKKCIFHVTWYTDTEEFESGTAFLIDSKVHNEKVLVTAFHFLWPDNVDNFTGGELPAYIKGGKIAYGYSGENTGATLKNCLIIDDADVIPNTDKDIATFTLRNGEELQTLPLATDSCKPGETIYLLANLWDTDDVHENCVYEAKVLYEEDGVLYYELDEKYGTTGASGAPLVNKYGEVVGIHIGSNGSIRIANLATNFTTLIDSAYPSDITYSDENLLANKESDSKVVNLEQDDVMNTQFFKLKINDITTKKELEGTYLDGYQFLILDLEMVCTEQAQNDDVNMYYDDFYVEWGPEEDEGTYPLGPGLTTNQLPDEYVLRADKETKGQLVFLVPNDYTSINFCYQDYYMEESSNEAIYGDLYTMKIKLDN